MLRPGRPRWRRILVPAAMVLAGAAVLAAAGAAGLRINISPSEPIGLWQVRGVTSQIALRPGDMVTFCAPVHHYAFLEPGNCPNGLAPFLKQIAAGPGDVVREDSRGVTIDGHELPDSRPLARAVGYDIALPQWRGQITLAAGQYWTYGSGWPRLSFDSRYWGPLPRVLIRNVASPVLVWNSHIWLP